MTFLNDFTGGLYNFAVRGKALYPPAFHRIFSFVLQNSKNRAKEKITEVKKRSFFV